ncbi:MAG: hypothetical protein GX465_12545 [Acidobacteria bacterium]|nr:hypothetical protein [Acidobacteriota bacterium]
MNPSLHVVQCARERPWVYANSGGPSSRQRTQTISSSILGKDDGFVRCPRIIRLGLLFDEAEDPVMVLTAILAEEGYGGPEALRGEFSVPEGRLICRPRAMCQDRLVVRDCPRRRVLEQALMLGLCTDQVFDPARPVLWTRTSLTRAVELFDPRGFYA